MKYILFLFTFFIFSCVKQQHSFFICGDHKCVNKDEAMQYFEDNLTLEVQIISKNKKSTYDLVDLNTSQENKDIKVFKNKNKKVIKKLSKEEIKAKKNELKKKKNKSNLSAKTTKKDNLIKTKRNIDIISSYKNNNNSIDICAKLDKCDIDSIANYLIKASNEKNYPNISLRE